MHLPMIGEIRMFSGTYAPAGWAFCDGALLEVSRHENLFRHLGTRYGGDGKQTFALPDLRGRAPIHASQPYPLAAKGATESVQLAPAQLRSRAKFGQLAINFVIALDGVYPQSDGSLPYIGELRMFPYDTVPPTWLPCDGQLLPVSEHMPFFSVIGKVYGAHAHVGFNVPDLRGCIPAHAGSEVALGETKGHPVDGAAAAAHTQPYLALKMCISTWGMYPSAEERSGSADSYVGEIRIFAGNFAPDGWAFCEGQQLPIGAYRDLFSIIGTNYGGNGVNSFSLPDLRNRVPIGAGHGEGLTPRKIGDAQESLESMVPKWHGGEVGDGTLPCVGLDFIINLKGFYPPRGD